MAPNHGLTGKSFRARNRLRGDRHHFPEARFWTGVTLVSAVGRPFEGGVPGVQGTATSAVLENLPRIARVETPLKIGLLDLHTWR
jgi:hypothetical protein